MGEYCSQFAIDGPKIPKNIKRRHNDSKRPTQVNKRYKTYKKKNKEQKEPFHRKDKAKTKQKNVKCYKCGKLGHYANRCYTKKKIEEIEDEGLRRTLLKIMINSTSEDDQSSSDEETSEEENYQNCNGQCCTLDQLNYYKSIVEMNGLYVLTTDEKKSLLNYVMNNEMDTTMDANTYADGSRNNISLCSILRCVDKCICEKMHICLY